MENKISISHKPGSNRAPLGSTAVGFTLLIQIVCFYYHMWHQFFVNCLFWLCYVASLRSGKNCTDHELLHGGISRLKMQHVLRHVGCLRSVKTCED